MLRLLLAFGPPLCALLLAPWIAALLNIRPNDIWEPTLLFLVAVALLLFTTDWIRRG